MGSPLLDIFLKWKISFSFRNVLHISCSKYLLISHCSHIELNFTLRFHSGIPFYCKRKPSCYWAKTSLTHFQINSFRKVKEKQCSVLFRFLRATLNFSYMIPLANQNESTVYQEFFSFTMESLYGRVLILGALKDPCYKITNPLSNEKTPVQSQQYRRFNNCYTEWSRALNCWHVFGISAAQTSLQKLVWSTIKAIENRTLGFILCSPDIMRMSIKTHQKLLTLFLLNPLAVSKST